MLFMGIAIFHLGRADRETEKEQTEKREVKLVRQRPTQQVHLIRKRRALQPSLLQLPTENS